ncbi:DUF3781 domain-containing protein [Methanobrevibacter sp.]|uniref:DUF3781 domain-containing protein n=1 Tax=Methanobrevibacter sp. TaxID=66852 RepID=UPI0025DEC0EF|nr:DUF3781 domain-containing protein [Methanobrevibacter sp.]
MQKTGDEMHRKMLLENVDKIHTTEMGIGRIQKNLGIDDEPVSYCISKLKQDNATVTKEGKNYYVNVDDCIITINSSSFTIITAHKN